jgi:hypothetical protein
MEFNEVFSAEAVAFDGVNCAQILATWGDLRADIFFQFKTKEGLEDLFELLALIQLDMISKLREGPSA